MKVYKLALLWLLVFFVSTDIFSQPLGFDTIKNQNILLGIVKREHLADSAWFIENYRFEQIPDETFREISEASINVKVDVYFGSWCEDSQRWLPVFVNIMDHTGLQAKTTLVGLPRSKEEREKIAPGIGIEKVPTFVFKFDGKEIGRIIENPESDLSKAVLNILLRK